MCHPDLQKAQTTIHYKHVSGSGKYAAVINREQGISMMTHINSPLNNEMGNITAWSVEALCYKLGHGFDSRRCHWIFQFT
jgi:hypothetical protein